MAGAYRVRFRPFGGTWSPWFDWFEITHAELLRGLT